MNYDPKDEDEASKSNSTEEHLEPLTVSIVLNGFRSRAMHI